VRRKPAEVALSDIYSPA